METKIAAYICKGCEIGQSLDIEKLTAAGLNDGKAALCKACDKLCVQEEIDCIKADIAEQGFNRVVIAACSQRVFPNLFDFGDGIMTERVNIREHVAWCHAPNDEDTQMLAEDYLKMGIVKLSNSEPPVPYIEETSKTILVVGGGISGLTAAESAALAGYKVVLVEKEDRLGGWTAKFSKVIPQKPPYEEPEDSGIKELIQRIEANQNITVYKSTVVGKISGQPGKFQVSLKYKNQTSEIQVGSIVMAAGWRPYNPEKLGHLGYGLSRDVVTNIQMEEMEANGDLKRPTTGKGIDSIVFIQCAGSRDQEHLPYCSAVCCRASLKQALYVRKLYPDAKIYIIYKDIRTPAQHEMFYAHVQNDDAVFLTKGEIAGVNRTADGMLKVDVTDTLLGEDISIKAEMVVLATGMVPVTKVEEEEAPVASDSQEKAEAKESVMTADGKKEASCAEKGAGILNLSYRQGTDLPTLKYGFPDSHFICFPFETRRTAIYAAGVVRSPMDIMSSKEDGWGAALKAIQAVEAVSRGAAVHPRSGDLSYPEFFMQRCTQCKRCTEECPFGTLDEDAKGTPLPNPFRCRRCAICMGACPERIISFKNYNVNMISQMIKSIHIPDEFEEKPRILAFVCENDALPAVDMAGHLRMNYNAMVRIIQLRCLGSMNIVWVGDALASGFDGVILIGCKKGDDYQCHYVRGSELAETRMTNVREKLKQLVLEEDRVQIHELAISEYHRIPKIFDDFLEVINTVGPNPYKGM
jgi:quinone-modifying oxidoreductase subunit QmoB